MKSLIFCSALLLILTACSKPAEEKTETTETTVTKSATGNVQMQTVALQSFRKTIDTTGTVAVTAKVPIFVNEEVLGEALEEAFDKHRGWVQASAAA